MPYNHWSDRLPYLVPVWHSISQRDLSSNSQNFFDPNLDIDFGGIGMYNQIPQRHYRRLQYKIKRPMLPFYIEPRRIGSNQERRNCLAFSTNRDLLFSYNHSQIRSISVGINEKPFQWEHDDVDCHSLHKYSENRRPSKSNPFCFHTKNIWNLNGKKFLMFVLRLL